MRTMFVVLALALLVMGGSALQCNNCVPLIPGGKCPDTIETCGSAKDTCVTFNLANIRPSLQIGLKPFPCRASHTKAGENREENDDFADVTSSENLERRDWYKMRIMRTMFVVLALALLVMGGSALQCNNCVPLIPGGKCPDTIETCGSAKDTCVTFNLANIRPSLQIGLKPFPCRASHTKAGENREENDDFADVTSSENLERRDWYKMRIMRTMFVVLALALLVMGGSALQCNNCVPLIPGGKCPDTIETCGSAKDTCVTFNLANILALIQGPNGLWEEAPLQSLCFGLRGAKALP
ncbi:hypothetical protein P4O66_009984 [Electrophorus voltai]|uniref:UPAR/Ly6 domain-containing protein n=1 Tax=Electrophorus voltai TaxID=2609070 RepID=A0AAD8Z8V7_9TELE|nr:hypothetical protein P4O66_009984 [Electrophorus voltai]